jgi:hypothetical protein
VDPKDAPLKERTTADFAKTEFSDYIKQHNELTQEVNSLIEIFQAFKDAADPPMVIIDDILKEMKELEMSKSLTY